ncbi:MAG: hypothetical protein ABWX84_09150 [Nocardioides sp.]
MTTEQRYSNPNAGGPEGLAGGMGVSSERVGPTGPGQVSTDGTRDVSEGTDPDDASPEQSAGGPEDNPDGLEPKAGYPTADPRSD